MIHNGGAGGGGDGLKVIAEGTYTFTIGTSSSVTYDLPQPASAVIMQRNPTVSMGTSYYAGFPILPGNTMPSGDETGSINISLDSTGTQLTFRYSGMGGAGSINFSYLALG